MRGIALPGQGQSIPSPLLRNTLGLLRVLQAPLYDTDNRVRVLRRHQEAIFAIFYEVSNALALSADGDELEAMASKYTIPKPSRTLGMQKNCAFAISDITTSFGI